MDLTAMSALQLLDLYKRAKSLYLYGDKKQSMLGDEEYDELERLVKQSFPDHPALNAGAPIPLDSPLQKKPHGVFMGSIANAMNMDEAQEWFNKHGGQPVYASLKVDGLSLNLQYDNESLACAITRGDTIEGEDVTHNALQVMNIPGHAQCSNVRGEIVLNTTQWLALKEQFPDYKTARNLASGMLRRKSFDPISSNLNFVAHFRYQSEAGEKYSGMMRDLGRMGFQVPLGRLCNGFQEIAQFHFDVTQMRVNGQLPYEIDGVVLTIDDLDYWSKAGIDSQNCPRAQVAWKFASEQANTRLKGIEVNVSQHGKMCPVGLLEPVQLGGVSVQRATLNNYQFIKDMGVAIGDIVTVARNGDVIPGIVGVADSTSQFAPPEMKTEIVEPTTCPVCGGEVNRATKNKGKEIAAESFCQNPDCDAKSFGRVRRWVKTQDMKGIGDEILAALTDTTVEKAYAAEGVGCPVPDGISPESFLVDDVADLYKLHQHTAVLPNLLVNGKRLGTKTTKLLAEIEKARTVTLERFIDGLGVKGLGERAAAGIRAKAAERLSGAGADPLGNLERWFENPPAPYLPFLVQYGKELGIENSAVAFQRGLHHRQSVADELLAFGVTIQTSEPAAAPAGGPLAGKVFCLTGDFPEKKSVFEDRIRAAGGGVEDDVRKNVTHVVMSAVPADDKLTGKGAKARKKGLPLISLDELLVMLQPPRDQLIVKEVLPVVPGDFSAFVGEDHVIADPAFTGGDDDDDGYPA